MPEPIRLLTQEEALERSGLSQWSLTKLVQEGRIRRYRRDGRAYYDEVAIRALINQLCVAAVAA
jgi:hypothetical protein